MLCQDDVLDCGEAGDAGDHNLGRQCEVFVFCRQCVTQDDMVWKIQ